MGGAIVLLIARVPRNIQKIQHFPGPVISSTTSEAKARACSRAPSIINQDGRRLALTRPSRAERRAVRRATIAAHWTRTTAEDLQRSRRRGRRTIPLAIVFGGAVLVSGLATGNKFPVVSGAALLGMAVFAAVMGPLAEWRLKQLAERVSKPQSTAHVGRGSDPTRRDG
jgi:hypothetical protein